MTAVESLESLQRRLASDGIATWFSHVRPGLLALLDRSGTLDAIGRDHVYPRVADGILAFVHGSADAIARVAVLSDLEGFLRQRQAQLGTSPEGLEVLAALEARLTKELAAANGNLADGDPADATGAT